MNIVNNYEYKNFKRRNTYYKKHYQNQRKMKPAQMFNLCRFGQSVRKLSEIAILCNLK